MTALGLLKIYSIVLFIYFSFITFNWDFRYTSKIVSLLINLGLSAVISLVMYILGWLFLIGAKWVLSQFGIVAGNDIVYVIVWIVLNFLGGVRHLI